MTKPLIKPLAFLLDVDGVLTDGKFYYNENGKLLKAFGTDDTDGLALLRRSIEIRFLTADRTGFEISKARIVKDMKLPLDFIGALGRIEWIRERWDPARVIYMGDGIFDHYVSKQVGYSIAPANADPYLKEIADYVTVRRGGEGAVAEACLHILESFFEPFDRDLPPEEQGLSTTRMAEKAEEPEK